MKQDAEFFDEGYFEHAKSHKGNYTRVGGYSRHAAGIDWAGIAHDLAGEGEYVLDVGCAYGHLVKAFRDQGTYAFGIDISEFAVSRADSEYVTVGDIRDGVPPVPGRRAAKKWDLITSFDVLEHCETREEARDLLALMAGRSRRQYHKVNTGEHSYQAFGGDLSHGLAMPLDEWRELAAEVSEETGCEIEIVL
jgi:SAM-dependent methyltransferase